jgi:hypothetical protein
MVGECPGYWHLPPPPGILPTGETRTSESIRAAIWETLSLSSNVRLFVRVRICVICVLHECSKIRGFRIFYFSKFSWIYETL